MATVIEKDDKFILTLSPLEKIGAFHGDITVDRSQLISIEEAPNPWKVTVLKGVRAPGTGIPFVIMLGTLRYRGGKDFAAVYKRKPVKIYNFKDAAFKRWIVSK